MASRKPRARSIKIDDKIVPGRIKSQSRGAISPKDRLLTCNSWIHSVHILVRPWWCCTDFDSPSHNLQRTEWLDGLLPSEFADWLLKAHDRSWLPLVRADWKYSVPHYYCCCWCQFRNMPQLFFTLIFPTNQILLLGIPYACLLRCFRIGVHYVWVLLEWYYHCIFRIRDQGAAAEKNKLRINPSLIILTDGRWTTPDFLFPSNLVCLHWKPQGSQLNTTVIQRNLTTVACDRHNKITPHEILFAAGIPTAIESIPVAYPT